MNKRLEVILGIFLGFLGVPSVEKIIQIVFVEQFSNGNPYALIGLVTVAFIGLLGFINSFAIIAGYENLGEMWDELGKDL